MDNSETFEFCIANWALQCINGILSRDWLSIHNPFINYQSNKIFFLGKFCGSHCPFSKRNKFFNQYNLCAAMIILIKESATSDKESIISKYYSDLKIVFEKKEAEKLQPHRGYDISIDLIPVFKCTEYKTANKCKSYITLNDNDKMKLEKSSIPLDIKPKLIYNEISQEMGLICHEYNTIKSQISRYKKKQLHLDISTFNEIPDESEYYINDRNEII
ncbi:hypothetical protein PIROE2DRAFT_1229 [Piromyces sp. E2]|nr:hypothetical protein PIROE2DRAFT_1229 [Piromyces sp. E2]|eukprot:OUM70681.1 hypothetical protein PIROE2DRAFT_1229 [Piromyces sp. E2]